MKVFDYVVVYRPRKEKDADELRASIVAQGRCVAKDEAEARTHAAYNIPEQYRIDLDRVEVLVRPF